MAFVEYLPRRGEAVQARELRRLPGGKGFNQAVAARRLGVTVELVGAVGADDFGREFRKHLTELGIGQAGVFEVNAPTGMALPIVDNQGENATVVAMGANHELRPDMLDAELLNADVVLVQGELAPATTLRALELGRGLKVLNAAPASLDLSPAVELADVVVLSELEAADMGGSDRLAALGAGAVVVTLGARGALIDNTLLPAPRVRVVDSMGAGDAFCAALGVGLAEGRELEAAVAWANRAAAAACLKTGTSEAMPTRSEIDRL